jgi:D-alanyl-D-alanine carboxypeptidase (penicillin-binding protein 5/6)
MSAADMAKLARAIIREFPDYYRWYSQREFTWNNIRQPNRNGLLARDPSVDGVKTGMTDAAGYCLVSSAKRDGMRLVAVVAGTESMKAREDASLALLNYGFNFYETRSLRKAGEELAVQRVYRARGGRAAVGLASDLSVTLPRGQAKRAEFRIELAPRVFAPLTKSDRVGVLRALVDGKVVAEAPIHPLADVPRGNIFRRIWDTILSWFA